MRLSALVSFFIFVLSVALPSLAISPEVLCNSQQLEELNQSSPSEAERMHEVCAHAGEYENSLLPDTNATAAKTFREGKAATYEYSDFFKSLTQSLGQVRRDEKCDPGNSSVRVAYPTVSLEKTAAGTIPVSVLKEEDLNKIFAEISKDPKYAFESVEDGCWARAHIIARELEQRGIRVAKIFAEGTLTVKTPKALNGEGVVWSYHVAPLVAVQTAKGVEMRVLDPALFDKPVPVKTWSDRMLPTREAKEGVELYITDRFVLDPLRGNSVKNIKDDPARGRWHVAETVLAEKELERARYNLQDREEIKAYNRKMRQLEGEQ